MSQMEIPLISIDFFFIKSGNLFFRLNSRRDKNPTYFILKRAKKFHLKYSLQITAKREIPVFKFFFII